MPAVQMEVVFLGGFFLPREKLPFVHHSTLAMHKQA